MTFTIGIDVGGTFTDIVVADADGRTVTAKAATTPRDQSLGVMEGLALGANTLGLSPRELLRDASRIVHGTTVATNALLEGKAARTGMLTTTGHRDVIEMREGLKPERYNLRMPPPEPLVPRWLRLGVRERLREDGSVETPLDAASLEAALDTLAEARVEAVAICFLHSWHNPVHERCAAEAVRRRLPDVYVTTSSDVLPEIKEFERFSTAVANAAVGPVIKGYLARLVGRLREAGFGGDLFVILSHGGVASVAEAGRLAVGTALSGPAGGVAAVVALARQGITPDLICFDMGGTSTDIAVIRGGQPSLSAGRTVANARIALPALDIVTLGAGGGSIAYLDPSGLLQVGPRSAGADPGPASYGRGGQEATVTDADVVLGYLDPAAFLGGRRKLDREAGEAAVGQLAAGLGLTPLATAAGIRRVIDMRMADAVRIATVRRGVDPRAHAMLAFGGAAGLHVCAVASELGISRVILPITAPVLSAWGMLTTDLRVELSRSMPQTGGIDVGALKAAFAGMEAEGRARLGGFDGMIGVRRSAEMRYGEQVFEVSVGLDGVELEGAGVVRDIESRFQQRHEALYTYSLPDQEIVLVNARTAVIGRLPAVSSAGTGDRPEAGPRERRRVYLTEWTEVPVFDFERLGSDQRIAGPAVIESEATTVLVRPGDAAQFDPRGWLEIFVVNS